MLSGVPSQSELLEHPGSARYCFRQGAARISLDHGRRVRFGGRDRRSGGAPDSGPIEHRFLVEQHLDLRRVARFDHTDRRLGWLLRRAVEPVFVRIFCRVVSVRRNGSAGEHWSVVELERLHRDDQPSTDHSCPVTPLTERRLGRHVLVS